MGILLRSTRLICANLNSISKFSSNPLVYRRERYTPRRMMSYLTGHDQPQRFVMARVDDDSIYYHQFLTDDNLSWEHSDLHVKRRYKYFLPYASCNALVLAATDPGRRKVALWNPTTGEIKALPKPIISVPFRPSVARAKVLAHGFGFDPATQDYKVIRFLYLRIEGCGLISDGLEIHLYSLKTHSWKEIRASVDDPAPDFSIHINGVCYWFNGDIDIMSFNFANEEFGQIPMPPTDSIDTPLCNFCFARIDDSFAVVLYDCPEDLTNLPRSRKFEIWKWDNDDVSWARVPVETDAVPAAADAQQLVALVNGNKLFVRDSQGEILTFDIDTRELKHLHLRSNEYEVFVLPYVESSFPIKASKVKKGRQRQKFCFLSSYPYTNNINSNNAAADDKLMLLVGQGNKNLSLFSIENNSLQLSNINSNGAADDDNLMLVVELGNKNTSLFSIENNSHELNNIDINGNGASENNLVLVVEQYTNNGPHKLSVHSIENKRSN
ncbi:F-box protein, partial [Striga asiatica]